MQSMISRLLESLIQDRLASSPAVALIGPRQCGKTTLSRSFAGEYFDLEQEPERLRLDLQWESLVAGRELLILDEAQSWPDVFPRLRGVIDRDRKRNGRFLILGSVSPALMVHVSESLAGRLSLVELTPFLWSELPTAASRDRLWLYGGYPDGGVLTPGRFPQWQKDYLTMLTQRDLPEWGLPAIPIGRKPWAGLQDRQ
jgi:predicted AAA+ superfamily ATPase